MWPAGSDPSLMANAPVFNESNGSGKTRVSRSLKVWKQQHVNHLLVYILLGKQKRKIQFDFDSLIYSFFENFNSQYQNSFTMESLILAQDER